MLDICFAIEESMRTMESMRSREPDRQFQFSLVAVPFHVPHTAAHSRQRCRSTDWKAILHNKNDWKKLYERWVWWFFSNHLWARERMIKEKNLKISKSREKQAIWLLCNWGIEMFFVSLLFNKSYSGLVYGIHSCDLPQSAHKKYFLSLTKVRS